MSPYPYTRLLSGLVFTVWSAAVFVSYAHGNILSPEERAFLKLHDEKIIVGQRGLLDRMLIGLLCDGHLLLEGLPGLAKTTAVKTLATAIIKYPMIYIKRNHSQGKAAAHGLTMGLLD